MKQALWFAAKVNKCFLVLRRLARALGPPAFIRVLQRSGYKGNYSSWDEAASASGRYDTDAIVRKVYESALKVKMGRAAYERDSVVFDRVQYSWPVLSALLWIALEDAGRLHLIDFGGSLGSSYYQNRGFLARVRDLRWNVVEQPKFVKIGQEMFADESLSFYSTLEECLEDDPCDTILLSGVLSYLEHPYELMDKIVRLGFRSVIIDRTLFIEGAHVDRLTVQIVPPTIYKASYPAWIFGLQKFLEFARCHYEVLAEFDALAGRVPVGVKTAIDKGFLLRSRSTPPC